MEWLVAQSPTPWPVGGSMPAVKQQEEQQGTMNWGLKVRKRTKRTGLRVQQVLYIYLYNTWTG